MPPSGMAIFRSFFPKGPRSWVNKFFLKEDVYVVIEGIKDNES
jgi:hypothetical protein